MGALATTVEFSYLENLGGGATFFAMYFPPGAGAGAGAGDAAGDAAVAPTLKGGGTYLPESAIIGY